jgi:signal transduction histidine kinase
MLERLTRSLSFRLLAIFLILASAFIYFSTVGIRWLYSEDDLRELISGHLSLHVNYVRQDIGNPPQIERALEITRQVPVDIRISGNGFEWTSDPGFPAMDELDFGISDIFIDDPGAWLNEIESSPRIADSGSGPAFLPTILAIGLIWLFVAYLCVNWLFRPIQAIRTGAAQIGKGDFDHRITGYRRDQLGDLAEDINRLGADVGGILDAKRQLLLGISHELRSPLSRLRLALEFFEDGDKKENLRAEISEMEQIISKLLEAERLNRRHAALNRTSVLVNDLVDQLVDDFFDRDRERILIEFEDDAIEANVDDVRLILILKNLLSNALRYSTVEDGVARMHVTMNGGDLVISIEDKGSGFSAEEVSNFGEPFYRGDPSRTRETGGTGLGLYLAKLAAEAHGGTLQIDQSYEKGARLVVRLPAGEEYTSTAR